MRDFSMKWNKSLEQKIKRYMREHEIFEVEINGDETLTLEGIPQCERDLWIRLWFDNELSTKQLLERIKEFKEYPFQWVLEDTEQFLKSVLDNG